MQAGRVLPGVAGGIAPRGGTLAESEGFDPRGSPGKGRIDLLQCEGFSLRTDERKGGASS